MARLLPMCVCVSAQLREDKHKHTQCQQMTTPLLLLFYGQLKFKKGRPLLPLSSSLSSYNVIITFCIGAQKQCGDAQSSFTFKCSKGGGNIAPDANELIYFVYERVLLLLRPRLL